MRKVAVGAGGVGGAAVRRARDLALILRRVRDDALYHKQDVIVDCGWYTGVGVHEDGDRHYLSQPAPDKRVGEWVATQQADGSWLEIPYTLAKEGAEWWEAAPQTHLCWLLAMAEAYNRKESRWHGAARLRQAILRGLDFWCARDFNTLGWWWTMIGIPRWLYKVLVLMEGHIAPPVMAKALEIMGRADGPTPWGKSLVGTAQNQVWAAENVFMLAALQNDPQRARSAMDIIVNEVAVRPGWGEGLQADYSFHQHGNTIYSGGYGYYYAVDVPRLALLVRGTAYAFPPQALEHIARYMLQHQRLIARGANYAYTVVGRLIARQGDTAWLLAGGFRSLARLPLPAPWRALARDTAAAMEGDASAAGRAFYGNAVFWRSDFMAQQRPGFHASVKLHSRRILNSDVPCNLEGVQNHHLSDGAFCLMRHGREYADLFPAWNWRRVPGITALQLRSRLTTATPIPTAGRRDFAGGVSDGRVGCVGYDFATAANPEGPDEVEARKSWFFFDDVVVWLGAGITGHADAPVQTSLNQCRAVGAATIACAGRRERLRDGRRRAAKVSWVHHDGVGYVLLAPGAVECAIGPVRGDWNYINGQIATRPVVAPLFYLGLPHGKRPVGATYACALLPGRTVAQTARWHARPSVAVLANTPQQQAVWHKGDGVLQAVFYSAGALDLPELGGVSVDRPCALLVRLADAGAQVYVAAPDHSSGELRVTLHGAALAGGAGASRPLVATLPEGNRAGATVAVL